VSWKHIRRDFSTALGWIADPWHYFERRSRITPD
jgi:hypothetical protein